MPLPAGFCFSLTTGVGVAVRGPSAVSTRECCFLPPPSQRQHVWPRFLFGVGWGFYAILFV